MTLSKQVQTSLDEAMGNVRNALAYAARHERPVTVSSISKLLSDIEHITSFDEIMDKIDDTMKNLKEKE
tara:strand:+ start:212 stop:418 length:207 start_codon:yes stop_codon:yes gene_type:complete